LTHGDAEKWKDDGDPMRRVRYAVVASLDGYIAGPKGETDWIIMDPEIDFAALFGQIMFAPGRLDRREREMVAAVATAAQDCHY